LRAPAVRSFVLDPLEVEMLTFDFSRSATVAGIGLVAISVLDLLANGAAPGIVHALVAGSGFALFAVAEAANAGR
jgi:hypothetical protein